MTYEERKRLLCQQCGKQRQCGYANRDLQDKCPAIQEKMEGWELGYQDATDKASKRLLDRYENQGVILLQGRTKAMARQDLIEQAAKKEMVRIASHATLYKGTIDEIEVYEPDDMIDMFKLGAEYADQNPINYDGKAMLHVLNKGRKIGYKDATERAVEFIYAQQLAVTNIEQLINELRKYIEEQQ